MTSYSLFVSASDAASSITFTAVSVYACVLCVAARMSKRARYARAKAEE